MTASAVAQKGTSKDRLWTLCEDERFGKDPSLDAQEAQFRSVGE
jgi:hypothetical protein